MEKLKFISTTIVNNFVAFIKCEKKKFYSSSIHVSINVCHAIFHFLRQSRRSVKRVSSTVRNISTSYREEIRSTKKILKYLHSRHFLSRSKRSPSIESFLVAGPESLEPDFVGAPYEFWVGANVPVGTSVGQIRLNDAVKTNDLLIYDLLHSYEEGGTYLRTINRATGCANL